MSISEIYALSLYAQGEGLPLWNPTPCRLADVGYMRDGTFHCLFNAHDGPQPSTSRSDAANIGLARRTEAGHDSRPTSPARSGLLLPSGLPSSSQSPSSDAGVGPDDLEMADAGRNGDHLEGASPSPPSSFQPQVRRSSRTRNLFSPSATSSSHGTDNQLRPPLPLAVEEAAEKVFDMGPRMSANMKTLGTTIGADASLAAAPVGAVLSFETSGGDGALLIPRDPTHRQLLLHVGVLKDYLKTHRRYIHNTFGQPEDLDADDIVLIYGQDLTSDWACAVNLEAGRGARVEFEVFSVAKLGVWGNWKTSCSASQRGPHRDASQYIENAPSPASTAMGSDAGGSRRGSAANMSWQAHGQLNAGPASVGLTVGKEGAATPPPSAPPFSPSPSSAAAASAAPSADAAMPERPEWTWAKHNPFPADQSVILRRITIKSRMMFTPKLQAAAGPRTDCDGKEDDKTGGGSGARATSAFPLMPLDPLDFVHEYIWARGTNVALSIAAEEEAVRLIAKVLERSTWDASLGHEQSIDKWIRERMFEAADKMSTIHVDEDGVAVLAFDIPPRETHSPDTRRDAAIFSRFVQAPPTWFSHLSRPTTTSFFKKQYWHDFAPSFILNQAASNT